MADYIYPVDVYFPNGVDVGQLDSEIRNNPNITVFLFSIVSNGEDVIISFDYPLTTAENIVLDNIIANHIPPAGSNNIVIASVSDEPGAIQLVTLNPTGGIIAQAGGGIIINSGATGIDINASNGPVSIGRLSGGDVSIGTAEFARDIVIGNNAIGTNIYQRNNGAVLKSQLLPSILLDSDQTLTPSNLFSQILIGTPTANRNLSLPLLVDLLSALSKAVVSDSFDFYIINTSLTATLTISIPIVGNNVILPNTSSHFRLVLLGTAGTTPTAFLIYRLV